MIHRALVLAVVVTACGGSTPAPENGAAGQPKPSMASKFANDDAVAYVVKSLDGRAIGRAHSVYFDSGDGLPKIRTRLAVDPGAARGGARSMELVVTLNTDLTPQAYKELHSVDGRLELRFKDREVTVITDNGVREVPYKRTGGILLPKGDLIVLAMALDKAGLTPGSTAKLSSISPKNPGVADQLSLTVFNDASGNVVAQSTRGKATIDQTGRVSRFEDTENGWIFEREMPPGEPPKIEPPADPAKYQRPASADWSDREVTIDVKDGQLAAILSEPRRSRGTGGGAPAIVFASDLGPQDRNGFGRSIDWGTWQMLDHLVDTGYAVLRVDDRGAGGTKSTIAPEDVGLELAADDLAACVGFLRAQPSIDPEKIFVIGQGIGGVAAIVLATKIDVAGIALVAMPFRPLPDLLAAEQAAQNGAEKDQIEREMRLAVSALEGNAAARAQVGGERLAELASIKAAFIESGKLDLAKTLAKVKTEIAVFQGMKDIQVSWRDDSRPLTELLKKLGNKKVKFVAYENVDHLMKTEQGESSYRRYADKSRRIEPKFLEDLGSWLGERMKAPPPAPAKP